MKIIKIFSCVVVDNDERNVAGLKRYISTIPYLRLLKTCKDPNDVLPLISSLTEKIDLLLINPEMSEMFQLITKSQLINKVSTLILMVSKMEHLDHTINLSCNHFLFKPFSQDKFLETINRAIGLELPRSISETENAFFIKSKNNSQYTKIQIDDVIAIDSMEHYVTIHTIYSKHIKYMSMKETEKFFDTKSNFIRVHKSHIISGRHIMSVNNNTILLTNNLKVNIGKVYRKQFYFLLDKLSI
ncbi:MAG: response regulator [Pedobacter sp.]|nr:MAG: response regulator [Pedobacter sp.]